MPQEFDVQIDSRSNESGALGVSLGFEFEDDLGRQLEDLLNPLADNLSNIFVGSIRDLLTDDETNEAASTLFDGAIDATLGSFGDGLSDIFVRAAKEGVGAFEDLDQVFADAAGVLIKSIGAALPKGLGSTLLGGPQGHQQLAGQIFSDFGQGIQGAEGQGVGFDLAGAILSGTFGDDLLYNIGAGNGVREALQSLGFGKHFSEAGGVLTAQVASPVGLAAGLVGSLGAQALGFTGSGDALIDTGLGLAGSYAGATLGTIAMPLLGAVAGPLGIAIGSFAGQALASTFADEDYPFAQAFLGIEDGQLAVLSSRELDGGPKKEIEELGSQVGERFDALLRELGGRIEVADGEVITTIGFASGREGKLGKGFFAGPNANFSRGADFTKLEGEDALVAGLITALQEAIRVGAVSGLSQTLLTAIPNIDTADFAEADALLQFANTFDATIRAFAQGVGDPQETASGQVATQIAGIINQIEEFRENTERLGLPLEDATQAMRGFAEFSLGFGDIALEQVSEIENELRRIAELHTLTNAELRILGLSRSELNAGLGERHRRVTEAFLAPFVASAAERADPGIGERTEIAAQFETVVADARLLGVDNFDDINAHFADAFRALFETLNSTALAEAERAQQSFTQLGESLREAYEALYFGEGGEGDAEERLSLLRGEFDEIAALALAGDEEALANLGGSAQELVEASTAVYGDGVQTGALRSFVEDILLQAIALAEGEAEAATVEIAALDTSVLSDGDALLQGGVAIAVPDAGGAINVAEAFDVTIPDVDEPIYVGDQKPIVIDQNLDEVSGLLGQLLRQARENEDAARDQRAETNEYLEEMLGRQRQAGTLFNA